MHYAAGSCALCAAFMLGAGSAVAVADPGSGAHAGSPGSHSDGTSGRPSRASDARSHPKVPRTLVKGTPPADMQTQLAAIVNKTINDVTSILNPSRIAAQLTSGGTSSAAKPPAASSTVGGGSTQTTATPPATGSTTPVSGTTEPTPVAATPPPVVPVIAINPYGIVPLIVSPVVDVISSVQNMLTSVVDYAAVPIATDLNSLLGVTSMVGPTQWPSAVNPRADASATQTNSGGMALTPLSFASPAPESVIANSGAVGLSTGTATDPATAGNIEATSAGLATTTPAETPITHVTAAPMTLNQFFKYAVDEVLRSPSLTALAAFALPGLIGLFIVLGAGIRFGYRQAKAALMLPTSTLARFARPAPLRLVRSRSSASVSKPAVRFVPTKLSVVDCALENAA
jgi:hypothetical protein